MAARIDAVVCCGVLLQQQVELVVPEPPPERVVQLTDMGFSDVLARNALILHRGSVQHALEWLLEHSDNPDAAQPPTQEQLQQVCVSVCVYVWCEQDMRMPASSAPTACSALKSLICLMRVYSTNELHVAPEFLRVWSVYGVLLPLFRRTYAASCTDLRPKAAAAAPAAPRCAGCCCCRCCRPAWRHRWRQHAAAGGGAHRHGL